jgi:exonuclease III
MSDDRQTLRIATLNVSGLPYPPHLPLRMRAIANFFETSNVDVLLLQEVHTYKILRFLKNNMPSFTHGTYVRTVFGPKGGLVIFSRLPVDGVRFTGVTKGTKKGMLITRINGVTVVNVHLSANKDGDWSPHNRYHAKQSRQLNDVARQMSQLGGKLVLAGDFNVARRSDLFDTFIERTHLRDSAGSNDIPSFHAKFLPSDRTPVCIDFILIRDMRTISYSHLFTSPVPLAQDVDEYVSSHHAVSAELSKS